MLRPVCFETGLRFQANSVEKYVLMCIVEQMVDIPVFLIMKEQVDVVQIFPRRSSERMIEQIINVPMPEIWKRLSKLCRRQVQQRIVEFSWSFSFHGLWWLRTLFSPSPLDTAWPAG